MSVEDALRKYSTRAFKKEERSRKPRRKNKTPERDVQKLVMSWLKANGFSCNVVESKAVWSQKAGRYLKGQTEAGVSDIFGSTPNGLACFIELKAPGKRATLKEHQRQFLKSKIEVGAFAICTDSVEYLIEAWLGFEHHKALGSHVDFLLKQLPKSTDDFFGG